MGSHMTPPGLLRHVTRSFTLESYVYMTPHGSLSKWLYLANFLLIHKIQPILRVHPSKTSNKGQMQTQGDRNFFENFTLKTSVNGLRPRFLFETFVKNWRILQGKQRAQSGRLWWGVCPVADPREEENSKMGGSEKMTFSTKYLDLKAKKRIIDLETFRIHLSPPSLPKKDNIGHFLKDKVKFQSGPYLTPGPNCHTIALTGGFQKKKLIIHPLLWIVLNIW